MIQISTLKLALTQLQLGSINRYNFLFFVLLWQHFTAVFVCDCGDFVEIKLLMLLFHFMPIPKGLTLRSVLPAFPGQSDGQAWLATVALLHLLFPFLCPSFTLCVPPSLLLFFSLPLSKLLALHFTFPTLRSVMTHGSCQCHDNWPAAHMAF